MYNLSGIKGFLFDIDGVMYVGSKVIEGAREAITEIRKRGYSCRFITNTSTMSSTSLIHKLQGLGFDIHDHEIFSAPIAARDYIRQFNNPSCCLLLAEDVKSEFREFACSDDNAGFIVIGDIGNNWSYPLLNNVFNQLIHGAQLIALHKNRFWQTEQGLQMDIGGLVKALEYASNQKSVVIGKPAPEFFYRAINNMGLKASEVAIIGDDIDSDIQGGQQVGLTGILVKTGKYRQQYVAQSGVKPDFIIDSIADLPNLLAH